MNITEFRILLSLTDGEMDAAQMRDAMAEMDPRGAPPVATFYRNLKSVLECEWVRIVGESVGAEGRGRPGQIYGITPAGRRALRVEAGRLKHLAESALSRRAGG